MSTYFIQGDARRLPLADGSVQCCVTSPPYYALRDYGHDGQLGLEETPERYVAAMVSVFREVRRVLRDDGTLWLNIGDSYAGSWGAQSRGADYPGNLKGGSMLSARQIAEAPKRMTRTGAIPTGATYKAKDLLGIPWMLAFALRADGWYLRQEIIWAKAVSFCATHVGSTMPESVRDRCTKSHEQLFLLTKRPDYFCDMEAVKEQGKDWGSRDRTNWKARDARTGLGAQNGCEDNDFSAKGRNLRSVWTINPHPFKGAHFACYPIKLVKPCIQAGTSERGCCPTCGAPWQRVVDRVRVATRPGTDSKVNRASQHEDSPYSGHGGMTMGNRDPQRHCTATTTTAWVPGCKCPTHEPVPCRVLDPFGGAATTALAAHELGRDCVIVEAKREYIDIGRKRLAEHRPHQLKTRRPRGPKPEPLLFK